MAKSSRSSVKKANNQRKAAAVFGPAESARAERLSARLLEIAKQPKPESSDVNMDEEEPAEADKSRQATAGDNAMELDSAKAPKRADKKRIGKRKQKKSSVAFIKYSDRMAAKKKKSTR